MASLDWQNTWSVGSMVVGPTLPVVIGAVVTAAGDDPAVCGGVVPVAGGALEPVLQVKRFLLS